MSWAAVAAAGGALVSSLLAPTPNSTGSTLSGIAAQQMANISSDQWNYYKENYKPLETSLASQAKDLNSPEQYAAAAGRANADVTNAFNNANRANTSRLQAYGINPGSPAYQSSIMSSGLAEGAANAGAQTQAYNTQRQLALNSALSVVGLGRNLPGSAIQGAQGSANAAGTMQNSLNSQYLQNANNMQAIGNVAGPLIGAAGKWYSTPSTTPSVNSGSPDYFGASGGAGSGAPYVSSTQKTTYAKGGRVIDMDKMADGSYGLGMMKTKHPITPHMKHKFAQGGGVGTQGLDHAPSQMNRVISGPGTETSDSIPAQIDGHKPAALSDGEFVMNAQVPRLTGDEILQAINRAGLEKRAQASNNAGQTAYADGGDVNERNESGSRREATYTPEKAPIGSGMAKRSVNTIAAKKQYDQESMDAQTEGREMPSFDEWLKSRNNAYADGGQVNQNAWKADFMRIAGYTPESVGITNERDANNHLLMMQQAHAATPALVDGENQDQDGLGLPSLSGILKPKSNFASGGKIVMPQAKPYRMPPETWEHVGGQVRDNKFHSRFGL